MLIEFGSLLIIIMTTEKHWREGRIISKVIVIELYKIINNGIFGGDGVKPIVIAPIDAEAVKIYGDVCIRKARRRRQKLLLLEVLNEYAENSTLHGLRYIVERGLHYVERVFWLITFFMSLAMCFYLIRNVWVKWITSPVIVSFSEKFVSVEEVPFPSITICPEQKVNAFKFNFSKYADKYDNYDKKLKDKDFDSQNFRKLSHLDLVCGHMKNVILNLSRTNSSLVEDIIEAAPSMSEVLNYCVWRGKPVDCDDIFKVVLTKKGVCFNFNALSANETLRENLQREYNYSEHTRVSSGWTATDGYTNSQTETYPRRGMENQATPDLDITLTESVKTNDSLCNILRNGYTIYVQHPRDLPQASLYYFAAVPGQITSLALKFNKITTVGALKDYPTDVRQCYFPDDRYLRYFKIYNSYNCRLECQSNYTFQKCGCVWFHMPHYNSTHLCTSEKYSCVMKALEQLSEDELSKDKTNDASAKCHCLPLCDAINYDADVLKTNFRAEDYKRYLQQNQKLDISEMKSKKFSKIEVYFKAPRFISMRRSELFGMTDFLANCGGLLGLFLGFSFLSLIEVAYFGTLRFYYRLKKDRRQEKKTQKEKERNSKKQYNL